MRALLTAKVLGDGLRFVVRAIPNRPTIPMVGDIKLEAKDASLVLTATDLDQQHSAVAATMECESGVVVMPGRRLTDLISKLPPNAEVTIREDAGLCFITCGRGRWKLPTLPPEEFPVLAPPGAEAASIRLPQAEAKRLVQRLAYAISTEETSYYLNGVYLHRQNGKLAAVATNRHVLAKILVAIDPDRDLKAIVPTMAVEAMTELASHGDVEIGINQNKISLHSGPWSVVSKLIDGIYPDYARVIPKPVKDKVEIGCDNLIGSIERHKAAAELDTGIGLTWNGNGPLITCLSRAEDGAAIEEIDAISSSGRGRAAVQAAYLIATIRALNAKTITLEHDHKQSGAPIRFTTTAEPDTEMVIMPITWLEPAIDDQSTPPTRGARGK